MMQCAVTTKYETSTVLLAHAHPMMINQHTFATRSFPADVEEKNLPTYSSSELESGVDQVVVSFSG